MNTSDNNIRIDTDYLKLRLVCESDPKPKYLDYENILRYIDAEEQEVMRCAKGYAKGYLVA